jgi:hypothetical protein
MIFLFGGLSLEPLIDDGLPERNARVELEGRFKFEPVWLKCHVCLLAVPDLRRNREGMREPGHTRAK